MSMGFSENRCIRALSENGNNVELALNAIFSTMDDPALDQPFDQDNNANKNKGPSQEVENTVAQVWPMIEGMGIDKKYIYAAAERYVRFFV